MRTLCKILARNFKLERGPNFWQQTVANINKWLMLSLALWPDRSEYSECILRSTNARQDSAREIKITRLLLRHKHAYYVVNGRVCLPLSHL